MNNEIVDLKIIIDKKPRVYLKWKDITETGINQHKCYERIEDGYIRYENVYNRNSVIVSDDSFFLTLEERFHSIKQSEYLINEK